MARRRGRCSACCAAVTRPSTTLFFVGFLALFFVVASGLLYSAVYLPPAMGKGIDPSTGRMTQRTIMPERLNGQFIIEGLAAGTFVCLGGLGFVLLRQAVSTRTKGASVAMACGGAALLGIGYNVLIAFVRSKVPNYLQT